MAEPRAAGPYWLHESYHFAGQCFLRKLWFFVQEVLAHARAPEFDRNNSYFPFTEETCRAIITEVSKQDELRPRVVMHAFNAVLQEADPRIEAGTMKTISVQFATQVLAEYVTLGADDQGEDD